MNGRREHYNTTTRKIPTMLLRNEVARYVSRIEDAKTTVSLLTDALDETLDDSSKLPADCEDRADWSEAVELVHDLKKLVAKFEAVALDSRGNVKIF